MWMREGKNEGRGDGVLFCVLQRQTDGDGVRMAGVSIK